MRFDEITHETFEYPFAGESTEAVFNESELEELAAELLSVTSEAELDRFLGKMFKKVGGALGKGFKALGKGLKGVASFALPVVGKMAGSFFGGPLGGMIGGKLGSLAGKAIGKLELEVTDRDAREFEAARRFVEFAGRSARNLAQGAHDDDDEAAAVRAMTRAADDLARARTRAVALSGPRTTGRWFRRGRTLVIHL